MKFKAIMLLKGKIWNTQVCLLKPQNVYARKYIDLVSFCITVVTKDILGQLYIEAMPTSYLDILNSIF